MPVISVKVSDEIAKACDGYEVEYREPSVGERFVCSNGIILEFCHNFMCGFRLVLTPKFDLAKWWPTWLKCDEVVYMGSGFWWGRNGSTKGCIANLTLLEVDCSQLDKTQVYRNPHREVESP